MLDILLSTSSSVINTSISAFVTTSYLLNSYTNSFAKSFEVTKPAVFFKLPSSLNLLFKTEILSACTEISPCNVVILS
jgi:hypothetical protein